MDRLAKVRIKNLAEDFKFVVGQRSQYYRIINRQHSDHNQGAGGRRYFYTTVDSLSFTVNIENKLIFTITATGAHQRRTGRARSHSEPQNRAGSLSLLSTNTKSKIFLGQIFTVVLGLNRISLPILNLNLNRESTTSTTLNLMLLFQSGHTADSAGRP